MSRMSPVRLLTWSTLLLSSIAWFRTDRISLTFSFVDSMFARAAFSIWSAWAFISRV